MSVTRRKVLHAAATLTATATVAPALASPLLAAATGASPDTTSPDPLFKLLEERIEAAVARHHIPGVALGVLMDGKEYFRGFGVTNVDYPMPIDENTLFRIGSITKAFTGTAAMRLVEQGILDLDKPVRAYLPDLTLTEESVASTVTVRQLLNHSAGWLGDDFADAGRGDGALAKYVAGMAAIPQLTPVGEVFAYNNAAVTLAGHLIATIAGERYEDLVKELVIDPLGLDHTGFFTEALVGYNIAASHNVVDGKAIVDPKKWVLPDSLNPTGGLIASVRDLITFARFNLADGQTASGEQLMRPASLQAMRTDPGPGGTILVEIDGVGVSWWRRRTAEGVPVFQHGGSWEGQYSCLLFIPDRGFAMALLTNSEGGPKLIADLFFTDWPLKEFVGLSDPPAVPLRQLPDLASYAGRFSARSIPPERTVGEKGWSDQLPEVSLEIIVEGDALKLKGESGDLSLAFYRDDYVIATDADGATHRSDFVRGPDGSVAWFRDRGRLYARQ
jgi:CubicO group peptidase (beta-lactamase class C family)